MALTASALASLVYRDLLAQFPTAAASTRENAETGVPLHNVPQAFIEAYCTGFVQALLTLLINDIGTGSADVPGTPTPATFSFTGKYTARAYLISSQGWAGPYGGQAASVFIDSVLTNTEALGLLVMNPNSSMGTGVGVVSPVSNPQLEAQALAALQSAIPAAFQASGKFGEGDVPSAPVNSTLLAQLPGYCQALAKGIASISAQVTYTGTGPTTPVSGIFNTGSIV